MPILRIPAGERRESWVRCFTMLALLTDDNSKLLLQQQTGFVVLIPGQTASDVARNLSLAVITVCVVLVLQGWSNRRQAYGHSTVAVSVHIYHRGREVSLVDVVGPGY